MDPFLNSDIHLHLYLFDFPFYIYIFFYLYTMYVHPLQIFLEIDEVKQLILNVSDFLCWASHVWHLLQSVLWLLSDGGLEVAEQVSNGVPLLLLNDINSR